jgi:hypothetical protein
MRLVTAICTVAGGVTAIVGSASAQLAELTPLGGSSVPNVPLVVAVEPASLIAVGLGLAVAAVVRRR